MPPLIHLSVKRFTLLFLCLVTALSSCALHRPALDSPVTATLMLFQPTARKVTFHSSLNGFKAEPALRTSGGSWQISVPGYESFRYFYTIDGKTYLPDCPLRENDDFGGENCIYSPEL